MRPNSRETHKKWWNCWTIRLDECYNCSIKIWHNKHESLKQNWDIELFIYKNYFRDFASFLFRFTWTCSGIWGLMIIMGTEFVNYFITSRRCQSNYHQSKSCVGIKSHHCTWWTRSIGLGIQKRKCFVLYWTFFSLTSHNLVHLVKVLKSKHLAPQSKFGFYEIFRNNIHRIFLLSVFFFHYCNLLLVNFSRNENVIKKSRKNESTRCSFSFSNVQTFTPPYLNHLKCAYYAILFPRSTSAWISSS